MNKESYQQFSIQNDNKQIFMPVAVKEDPKLKFSIKDLYSQKIHYGVEFRDSIGFNSKSNNFKY